MKNKLWAACLAAAAFAANPLGAAECPKGFEEAKVSGMVNTTNVDPYFPVIQVGTIELQVTSIKNGKVLFGKQGAIVGQVADVIDEVYPPVTLLQHNITFDKGFEIETSGDRAIPVGQDGCRVLIHQVINDFWGTKIFKRATGEITADGSISTPFCEENYNEFTLGGYLCVEH